ncbi:hypothetical protein ACJX0J_006193, partial [Zea mays]
YSSLRLSFSPEGPDNITTIKSSCLFQIIVFNNILLFKFISQPKKARGHRLKYKAYMMNIRIWLYERRNNICTRSTYYLWKLENGA